MIGRESARRNSAVDVGMQKQVLSPGVQDADHADLCAQVFAIDSDLQQGLRAGGEQQVVEQTRVLQRQHIEFVGHSEYDMEVTDGQEFTFTGRQPALARLRLTLGAVPISARVVRDSLMTAARAGIAMAAQRSGATAQNGTKRFELLKVKARSIAIQEAIALRAKDVGHLEGGPSHFSYFRLKLRRMLAVLDSTRPSNGLVTACRCRCDRCRYWAVVSRSPCPSRTWRVRRSVPASNKWVAQLWRSVCGVTRLRMPARRAASLHAIQTVLSEMGCSGPRRGSRLGNK